MTTFPRLTIALAGNPNSGKTTIFNNITGTRQKVGNWPGVTVAKKEGTIHRDGYELRIIDLPGTYSLTPFSIEEIVARDFVLDEHPDVVIDIIDASNLERSLYLATQLREIDCKVIFALNMADVARSHGVKINAHKLSELLDVPVVFTIGNKNKGMDELLQAAIDLGQTDAAPDFKRKVKYNHDVEKAIGVLQEVIEAQAGQVLSYNPRWTAIKLLEDDKIVKERLAQKVGQTGNVILEAAQAQRRYLMDRFEDDPEVITTDERYGFIAGIVKEIVTTSTKERVDLSRDIDLVLTNRFVGFPIFLFFIWAMFQLTFTVGEYPMGWIESGIEWFSALLDASMPESMVKDLFLNGIIAGVGSVIVFLPNILILFFCIALFEDTGYMARAAFLMDRVMHLIGLHGKSFIPMLMGFGCNVPAIIATRTLESEKDRILTILITPFMSCSAKLPVYIVLAGTFFGAKAGTVIFGVYLLGIVLSIMTGRLFRSTLLRGADAPFVMELPPYRVPMFKSLLIHMWERSKMFLKKMGGIILVGSVVVWTLSAFPRQIDYAVDYEAKRLNIETSYNTAVATAEESRRSTLLVQKKQSLDQLKIQQNSEKTAKSFMGRIGQFLAPVFAPLGIDWRGGIALVTGFVAKEIVVSTLGVLYQVEDTEDAATLDKALKAFGMSSLSALSMMVFVLLYLPCLATVATIKQETGSYKWMLFSIGYSTSIAWIMALIVYQGGKLLGLG